ncbi:MAG: sulfatase-like hydrolase/transferase [Kiritimatiellaeota bacterium]|nr:sulfatase-like hydrolase/transferase [Kiritimatiellota bacterium]
MNNLVLFMSDEHNPFYSSVYGHPFIRTPALERLAREGTVFRNAYCPSPLCLPSRSAFMAGRFVHEIQTYSNCNVRLRSDLPSYGRLLGQRGVHTVYVGKTDVYAPSDRLGFSEMLLPGDRRWPGDVNHRRRPLAIRRGSAKRADGFGPRRNACAGDARCIAAALDWLRADSAKCGKPWLLAINTGAPHFPHFAPSEFWDMYPQGADLPEYGPDAASARHPVARDLRAHFETDRFAEFQVRGLRRGYLACVSWVDRQLGRLLDALEARGLRERTNVVYTADHGEMLGKFGMWWKCSLYEDSVRVPLVVSGPDFPASRVIRTPVSLLDLYAGLYRVFESDPPPTAVGTPLQDLPEDDPERVVLAEYHGHGVRSGSFMVRKGDWKLLFNTAAPHQLFNVARDPDELDDCLTREPEKAAELEAALREICNPEREDRRAHEFEAFQLEIIDNWGLGAPRSV